MKMIIEAIIHNDLCYGISYVNQFFIETIASVFNSFHVIFSIVIYIKYYIINIYIYLYIFIMYITPRSCFSKPLGLRPFAFSYRFYKSITPCMVYHLFKNHKKPLGMQGTKKD